MNELKHVFLEHKSWVVDGLTYAGLIFGPPDGTPVLALHGWLDNAAGFVELANALPNLRIVAVDLSGHGLSDHRSANSGYQIWDDLPQLAGLLDQLGWEKCVLLGHSRGAMIATLLGGVMPHRVRALITMDALLPYPVEDDSFMGQLGHYLRDRERLQRQELRVFSSKEDYVARRARAGEPANIAAQLADRALRKVDGGYEWRGDPRLSGASALKLNAGQCKAMLKALTMPVLNIWATPSERMKKLNDAAKAAAAAHIANLAVADVPGHHHWHMEAETAREIAKVVEKFLG